MRVMLNAYELAELDLQNPATKGNGGWQRLIVGLQEKVNRATGELILSGKDIERIARYAFDYRRGGWQGRLMRIFGRSLGPNLGRGQIAA